VICVALHFCTKDFSTMIDTLKWMASLHGTLESDALLVFPSDTSTKIVASVHDAAKAVFQTKKHSYSCPARAGWPLGPNLAWQATARHMLTGHAPWLWLEADAIPIKADWLIQLEKVYAHCGKSFMGPIVPHMGHCNGVAIYPANSASRCPKAMAATNQAWDYLMREEMIHDCHDASDLMFHFWGLVNGRPHHQSGNAPHFSSINDVKRWIPESAVLMHRCKDRSLTKILNESLNLNRKLVARPQVA